MRVYLSGCISGLPKRGYLLHFKKVEQVLEGEGYEVINPASIGFMFPTTFTHQDYMDIDLALLSKCDVICMLQGWEYSAGAKEEYEYAIRHDMEVIYEEEL